MKASWLKDLEGSYKGTVSRRPFLGQVILPSLPGLPQEMLSGVAVYPKDACKRLLKTVVANRAKKAFDVALGDEIAPLAVHSRLIWNFHGPSKDKPPTFVKQLERGHPKNALPLNSIPTPTVLFHRCKDGSLINLLRGDCDATIPQILMAWLHNREIAPAQTNTSFIRKEREPLFFHVVERHAQSTPEGEERVLSAVRSWIELYKTGKVVPCHLWENDFPRDTFTMGDKRRLPYFKDVIAEGMTKCKRADDVILWTNDDTVLHPGVVEALATKLKSVPCVGSFRVNFDLINETVLKTSPDALRQRGERDTDGALRNDLGRDLFAWKKAWLTEHWLEIPDFILGELEFDVLMAAMIRREAGIFTDKRNVIQIMPSCELEKGYVLHQKHARQWTSNEHKDSPAKLHNKKLAIQWYAENGLPSLISNF